LIHVIFVETALETIPKILWDNPKIKIFSKRRAKHPSKILLDASKFHYLMKKLDDFNKRGRPDIIHFSLLLALGSEINKRNLLKIYIHTINNFVIRVNPEVRLPRNYNRFIGLIEQLFEQGEIKDNNNNILLSLKKNNLKDLLNSIKCNIKILLQEGHSKINESIIKKLFESNKDICFLIGGFPHGNFTIETINLVDLKHSISDYLLDAWNVTAKLISLCENVI
jgi:rRNA small subunit pseudouridine methyltransferase Nep1